MSKKLPAGLDDKVIKDAKDDRGDDKRGQREKRFSAQDTEGEVNEVEERSKSQRRLSSRRGFSQRKNLGMFRNDTHRMGKILKNIEVDDQMNEREQHIEASGDYQSMNDTKNAIAATSNAVITSFNRSENLTYVSGESSAYVNETSTPDGSKSNDHWLSVVLNRDTLPIFLHNNRLFERNNESNDELSFQKDTDRQVAYNSNKEAKHKSKNVNNFDADSLSSDSIPRLSSSSISSLKENMAGITSHMRKWLDRKHFDSSEFRSKRKEASSEDQSDNGFINRIEDYNKNNVGEKSKYGIYSSNESHGSMDGLYDSNTGYSIQA